MGGDESVVEPDPARMYTCALLPLTVLQQMQHIQGPSLAIGIQCSRVRPFFLVFSRDEGLFLHERYT